MDTNQLALALFSLASLLKAQSGPRDEEAALWLGYIFEELAGLLEKAEADRVQGIYKP
jgi:hypothetical protein